MSGGALLAGVRDGAFIKKVRVQSTDPLLEQQYRSGYQLLRPVVEALVGRG